MSRRRGQSLAPSLFPFLAVLVCTLGTLILLLALVAQNATDTAEQRAQASRASEATPQIEDQSPKLSSASVEAMLVEEQFRVEQLVAFRDQQTADLESRRDELTHLEEHMERLRSKLKAISDEVNRATGDTESMDVDETAIAELHRRIEEQRNLVDNLRASSADQSPRVVIVPHKGPNGTDRRPIYLECSQDGITIWPEGSQISLAELSESAHSANPLDAALRTIRLHALKNYGDTVSPYPLLLVRPDGIESYAAARRAMRDWDDQFGYELVPADVNLAYGKVDPELKRRVDVAIRTAIKQQAANHALAARAGVGGRAEFGSATNSTAGRSRLPILSAAQLDREGRTGGFRSLREPTTMAGSSPRLNPPNARTSSGTVSGGSPYGNPGGAAYSNPPSTVDEATEAARRWTAEMHAAAREMREERSLSSSQQNNPYLQPQGETGRTPHDDTANASQGGTSNAAQSDTLSDARGDNVAPIQGGADGQSSPHPDSLAQSATAPSETNDPSSSQRQDDGSPNQMGERSGSMASMPTNAVPPSGAMASMPMPTTMLPNQTPASSTDPSQGAANPSSSPSLSSQADDPMVQREGRDWALPPHMMGTRGGEIVRSIRAECYSDRFVLPPSNHGSMEVFGLAGGDIESATMRLATSLRSRIDRWGPALPGARWQPRLDVIVHPGGETRFHQLRTLMMGSGIEVVGRAP
jgi:hypothetical protein